MPDDQVDPESDASAWARARSLAEAARALDPADRRAFVQSEAENTVAAARALRLLDIDDPTTERRGLNDPIHEDSVLGPGESEERATERIGPWELRRRIGRGGMADVWLAARADGAYRRRVAIKRLHPGLATPEVVLRFERERQILASLVHPGIAKMLEAGTDANGTPYLVMELVDGQRLDEYANERRLGTRARVALIARVADAVMAAHRMHVVHRDIKPSNVLVDLEGRPTLLDFGIATVLDPEKDVDALVTRDVNRFMTPNYASPEQLAGRPLQPTSDVYSLGVLTYCLLTGFPPLDLAGRSTADVVEFAQTREPDSMAACVRRADASEEIARSRGTTQARLVKELDDSELEAVVGAALRKEPARRPPDAGAFRDELQRWLAGEPVQSRRDTWIRRTRRVVARNRAVASLAILLIVALVAGFGVSLSEARRANRAARSLETETRVAEERLDSLRQSTRVLLQDAIGTLGGVPGARHALDRLMRMGIVIARRESDPELRSMLGRALVHQARLTAERTGISEGTLEKMRAGIELSQSAREDAGGGGDPDLPHMRTEYASALIRSGRLDGVDEVLDAALDDASRMHPTNAGNHADVAAMRARIHSQRAQLLKARGQFTLALAVVDSALAEIEALRVAIPDLRGDPPGDDARAIHADRDRARLEFVRLALLGIEGKLRNTRSRLQYATSTIGASIDARRAADIATHLNAGHGANMSLSNNYAATQQDAAASALKDGDLDGAQAFHDRALEALPELTAGSGADDVYAHLASAWTATGLALARGEDDVAARELTRMVELLDEYERVHAPFFERDWTIAMATQHLGQIAYEQGRTLDASAALVRSYELLDDLAQRSPEHFAVAADRCWAALALHELLDGEADGAPGPGSSRWLERARAHWEDMPGDESALESLSGLGAALQSAR